jgi:SAM-dependent methyltransferase
MKNTDADSKRRFSDRVEHYIRNRPGYPPDVVKTLAAEAGLSSASVVADVGSGPGMSSAPFLEFGATVYGVEPNESMRQAAEERFQDIKNFHSVAGTAEATTLPDASVDFVVAGQAFHWFDSSRARREFARILRPSGYLVILWNSWNADATPFLRAYEDLLLRFGTDYKQVDHRNVGAETIGSMFVPATYRERRFAHAQIFDFGGLEGRLLSSSYIPLEGHPNYAPMMAELRCLFDAYQRDGRVQFDYETLMHFGRIAR